MIAIACPPYLKCESPFYYKAAQNEFSHSISESMNEIKRKRLESQTFGNPLETIIANLSKMSIEYSDENWNGYDSLPINKVAVLESKKFLELLYDDAPLPNDTSLTPDGCVVLEWYKTMAQEFSVSFCGENKIYYSGIFNEDRISGVLPLNDVINDEILKNISTWKFLS